MIFPWPGKDSRQEAIDWARDEKERSLLGAADAAGLREQLEQMAREARMLPAGLPGRRMRWPVFRSGRMAD
jgi:hypothetical protein